MEENITQTTTITTEPIVTSSAATPGAKPMVDVMPTSGATTITKISYQKKKRTGWIILLIVLSIVIVAAVWFFYFHKKAAKPFNQAATLQTLQNTSKPVTATVAQRATAVTALSKQSLPATANKQNQLYMLNELSK